MSVLGDLQSWFLAQCDGEWEHQYGVMVETLDNPGWSVRIDLVGTALAIRRFERHEVHRTDDDWLVCWRDEHQFHVACGPKNLDGALRRFLTWADAA